jgi:hypothetical protein
LTFALPFHDRGNEAYFMRSMRRTDDKRVQFLVKTMAAQVQIRCKSELLSKRKWVVRSRTKRNRHSIPPGTPRQVAAIHSDLPCQDMRDEITIALAPD